MIFLRNESFRSYIRFYPVTATILAVNLIVFILDTYLFNQQLTTQGMFYQERYFNRYGLSEPWRLITSIVLHADWEHLLYNCFSILVFAPPLEKILGHFRYLLFYLAAGVAGNALSAFIHVGTDYASVGASGAIYGVFGAFLFLAIYRKFALDEATRTTIYTILIFGLIYSVIVPHINIWAHIGGGAFGFAMMGILAARKSRRLQRSLHRS